MTKSNKYRISHRTRFLAIHLWGGVCHLCKKAEGRVRCLSSSRSFTYADYAIRWLVDFEGEGENLYSISNRIHIHFRFN